MSSHDPELLDFERDVRTTPEDIQALRRSRDSSSLDLEAYLRFLAAFEPPPPEELRARKGPRGSIPFSLREAEQR